MFYYVKGEAAFVTDSAVVVEAGGVGYSLSCAPRTAAAVAPGQTVTLYTYLAVRDDGLTLFGFLSRDELSMFTMLLAVGGLGPKGALGLLSALTPERIALAIASEDAAALSKAPGIGKKTAARIILEMKDKIPTSASYPDAAGQSLAMSSPAKQDALDALTALGYPRADALRAVLASATDDMDAEQIIKSALRRIKG